MTSLEIFANQTAAVCEQFCGSAILKARFRRQNYRRRNSIRRTTGPGPEKTKLSPEDYVASINQGFAEAKRFGTTTIANLTAFPELVSRVQSPIRTWWFAELIDVRDPSRASETVEAAVNQLKSAERWGLA